MKVGWSVKLLEDGSLEVWKSGSFNQKYVSSVAVAVFVSRGAEVKVVK